ncbi:MAG: mannose-6-phosphate isomerase [Gemmataceae bacterium]|nr:mannose-6-phosphate isomerase [Gemmataceae bacterium]
MFKLLEGAPKERPRILNEPLRFKPFPRPRVWGGRKLESLLGKSLPDGQNYGESWEISDHASHASEVLGGNFDGKTLRWLMETQADNILGPTVGKQQQFPWLIKYLDAQDWLSVQVHPDEKSVEQLWPGEGSKNEAWFILEAVPGSRIYAGLLPGVNAAQVRAASLAGTVADLLHQFHPQPGDCLYLPAGTVHAIGCGVLMAEIQQTSDATFRLFDWNRKDATGAGRPLHLEESLACIDWTSGPPHPIRVPGFGKNPVAGQIPLVNCPYFKLEYHCQRAKTLLGGTGKLQAVLALSGEGTLGGIGIQKGETLLFPASMGEIPWAPLHCQELLLATLP